MCVTFTAVVLWGLLAATHSQIHQGNVSDMVLELDTAEGPIKICEYLS